MGMISAKKETKRKRLVAREFQGRRGLEGETERPKGIVAFIKREKH